MRRLIHVLGLALALALPAAAGERRPVQLVKVIDGDTLRVDIDLGADVTLRNQPIRILGVDAPELHGRERPRGLATRAALGDFLTGKALTIELRGKDKYGRWLAEVYAGGESVSAWLLRERLARPYTMGSRAAELSQDAPPASNPTETPTPAQIACAQAVLNKGIPTHSNASQRTTGRKAKTRTDANKYAAVIEIQRFGAGDGDRTRDVQLGKLAMSYDGLESIN